MNYISRVRKEPKVILFNSKNFILTHDLCLFMQILDKVGLAELIPEVDKTLQEVVLPSYSDAVSYGGGKQTNMSPEGEKLVEAALKRFLSSINEGNVKDVS